MIFKTMTLSTSKVNRRAVEAREVRVCSPGLPSGHGSEKACPGADPKPPGIGWTPVPLPSTSAVPRPGTAGLTGTTSLRKSDNLHVSWDRGSVSFGGTESTAFFRFSKESNQKWGGGRVTVCGGSRLHPPGGWTGVGQGRPPSTARQLRLCLLQGKRVTRDCVTSTAGDRSLAQGQHLSKTSGSVFGQQVGQAPWGPVSRAGPALAARRVQEAQAAGRGCRPFGHSAG